MLETLLTKEVLTLLGAGAAIGLTALLVFLRKKAAETDNKIDDELVDALDKAVEDSKK
jgi:hypothetical protein